MAYVIGEVYKVYNGKIYIKILVWNDVTHEFDNLTQL